MNALSYDILISTANKLACSYFKRCVNTLLKPIDYTRTKEIPVVIDVSRIMERKTEEIKILDIGSPQILSLSLCSYSASWTVVYVNPFDLEFYEMQEKSSVLGIRNIVCQHGDITDSNTLQNLGKFDYIFSCSVFEHIHPEDGGDVLASKNIYQLLRPYGVFSFSVPFCKKAFNEYKDGASYHIKGELHKPIFFQRFYDEETLVHQIIEPSGLTVLEKTHIGERFYFEDDIRKRMVLRVGHGKRSLLLGRFFRRISDIFMEVSPEYRILKKPYLAVCSLGRHSEH
jgi:SAM-dependent methyltransferase